MDVNQPKQEHLLALKGTDSATRRCSPTLPGCWCPPCPGACPEERGAAAGPGGATGPRRGPSRLASPAPHGGPWLRTGREAARPLWRRGRFFPPLQEQVAARWWGGRCPRVKGGWGGAELLRVAGALHTCGHLA